MLSHILAEAQERARLFVTVELFEQEDALWMDVCRLSCLLDAYPAPFCRQISDAANRHSTDHAQRIADAQVRVLLRKLVAVNWCSGPRRSDVTDEAKPRHSSALIDQLVGSQRLQPEILAPGRLVLAPVSAEQVGQYPPRLLLRCALFRINRDVVGEPFSQPVDLFLSFGQLFARAFLSWRRSWHFGARGD
jgi:hypothetical protein